MLGSPTSCDTIAVLNTRITDEHWHPASLCEWKCINQNHSILTTNPSHASKEG